MLDRNSTPSPVKVLGWFFYVDLLTKRKNECKQRQKKYAKGQHILEIKAISHRHHLHSMRMKGQPTLQHGCSIFEILPYTFCYFNLSFLYNSIINTAIPKVFQPYKMRTRARIFPCAHQWTRRESNPCHNPYKPRIYAVSENAVWLLWLLFWHFFGYYFQKLIALLMDLDIASNVLSL